MAWSTEKTKTGQDLVWSGVENGIAPSPSKGTANLQNVNISTESGEVMASFGRTAQQQTALTSQTLTPDGATLFDAPATLKAGQWIRVTASTVSSITADTAPSTAAIDYLVVGGGGAGGGAQNGGGGGGGAGGFMSGSSTVSVQEYTVTVGAGGTGVLAASGNNGEDSVLEGIATATGGGGGGSHGANGANGGSGGGGGGDLSTSGTGGTGDGAPEGRNGGVGFASGTNALRAGGGGGGAGAVGAAGTSGDGGDGGNGSASSISGASVTYSGGGGGGAIGTSGTGGTGGGGAGADAANGTDGTANTGGGGGGSSDETSTQRTGGNGGSGIVIISYTTGALFAIGGTVTTVGTKTIHTFTTSGTFEVFSVSPTGLYFVSYKNGSNKIKLSSAYDPYGTDVITHGTTGSITFSTLAIVNSPIARTYEKYGTATDTEYRYYILDVESRLWVYDTQVYDYTLANNGVGVTWMLPDPLNYSNVGFTGLEELNGWLVVLTNSIILGKPTVCLGQQFREFYGMKLMNPFPTHPNFAYVGSQGKLRYTDGNFIGEIFPTTSLITSEANIQSYAEYSATTTEGAIDALIGGSVPYLETGTRVPVVFFPENGGTLPTAISQHTVYYVSLTLPNTFEVYAALTGGSAIDIETGAVGTQYFNTFYPVESTAGAGSTTTTVQFSPQRVNLPFYELAQSLVEVSNTVIIGCKGNTLYPWNQVDATPSDIIPLPEADVKTMVNVNNTVYVFAGSKGNIYITNNSVASLALKVPDYCAGVPGTPLTYIEPYFTWGDAMFLRGRVYFSILDQTSTKAGNCGGVWSFIPSQNIDPMQDVGMSLRNENQNSYGDYDGYATVLIAPIEQLAIAPQYWAGWQDSYSTATSSFGIDFTASTPVTQYIIETDLVSTGTLFEKATFAQFEYKATTPLLSGDIVQLYWRLNSTSAWTSAGTVEEETGDRMSGIFKSNVQKTQYMQLRAVVTTGGTTSSSFARLSQLRIR